MAGLKTAGKLCSRTSDLCLEGYPSSGNSYLYMFIKNLTGDLDIAHHTHSLANVKLALKLGVPVAVSLRNPVDAITSRCVRFHCELEGAAREYLEFYSFIRKHGRDILIVPFSQIISRMDEVLKTLSRFSGLAIPIPQDMDSKEIEVKDWIWRWSRKNSDTDKISLPREKRNGRKGELKKTFEGSGYYSRTMDLFRTLMPGELDLSSNPGGHSVTTRGGTDVQ